MTTTTNPALRVDPAKVLGVDVTGTTTIADVMILAGIDYRVETLPLKQFHVTTDDGVAAFSLPGQHVIYRPDTGRAFGVAGDVYRPVQTADAFALADDLHTGGARFRYAGEITPGRPYVTMDVATIEVADDDKVTFAIELVADHNGRASVRACLSALRLVCTNGLTVGMPGLGTEVKVRHTRSADVRLEQARHIMADAHRYAKGFEAVAAELVATPMTRRAFTGWIDTLYPEPDEPGRAHTIWSNRRAALLDLFARAGTNEAGRGTRWAAFNAVTEHLSWGSPTRGGDDPRLVRARRQLDDTTRTERDRAFALITGGRR